MTFVCVAAGTVVVLPAGAWRQGSDRRPADSLRIVVARVMHELDRHAGRGEVWVEGTRLDDEGRWGGVIQACARIDALIPAGRPA